MRQFHPRAQRHVHEVHDLRVHQRLLLTRAGQPTVTRPVEVRSRVLCSPCKTPGLAPTARARIFDAPAAVPQGRAALALFVSRRRPCPPGRQASRSVDPLLRSQHSPMRVRFASMIDWREHLSSDPKVCQGQLCAKGTRVLVTNILDSLAEGADRESILRSYPTLRP